jgi:hypothetical protein
MLFVGYVVCWLFFLVMWFDGYVSGLSDSMVMLVMLIMLFDVFLVMLFDGYVVCWLCWLCDLIETLFDIC